MPSSESSLEAMLSRTPYAAYAYSYPHKTAYRPLTPPIALRDAWKNERRDALFLYLHVPFCEMRCGFCNLFTTTNRSESLETEYVQALQCQSRQVNAALGKASFSRLAIGGGTPTYLSPGNLHALFDIVERDFGTDPRAIPVSVETSPQTSTVEKLNVLRERGVDRVSIGVQSFTETEVHAIGRPQRSGGVHTALERIRAAGFSTLNIDLMYGLPGQTVATWLQNLQTAMEYAPEEIYLYPLYVRPLTGLDHRGVPLLPQVETDIRLECYRRGREFLFSQGYRQTSMRMFQRTDAPTPIGPVYCCQEDGMVGLGSGARSYTSDLHYSGEYAVGATNVRQIIDDYVRRPAEAFDYADYGFQLDEEEQRRRYLIHSLLQTEGLDFQAYAEHFGTEAEADVPQLAELEEHGLAVKTGNWLRLNEFGIERSDTIGPWLGSTRVRSKMEAYVLK